MKKIIVRIARSGIVILLLFCGSGCDANGNIADSSSAANNRVILEVVSETSETVYPRGKILVLRLYDNSVAQFDFYPPNTPDRVGMPFESSLNRRSISQDKLASIVAYMDSLNFSQLRDVYEPTLRPSDAFIKETINLQSGSKTKKIVLEENDSHLHLDQKSESYGAALVILLRFVEKLNLELRKEMDPNSR